MSDVKRSSVARLGSCRWSWWLGFFFNLFYFFLCSRKNWTGATKSCFYVPCVGVTTSTTLDGLFCRANTSSVTSSASLIPKSRISSPLLWSSVSLIPNPELVHGCWFFFFLATSICLNGCIPHLHLYPPSLVVDILNN
jgi:hypothetical protein